MIVPDVKPILNPYLAMTSEKYLKEVTVGPVSAMPFDDNAASCRILENCGFSLEGILRCNAVKNGTVRDMRMYAALSALASLVYYLGFRQNE